MEESKYLSFSLGYVALKLLGKGQYSNVWSALSELIANGIDANATRIDIYIDMRDKQNSIVEILDNGVGMDYENVKNDYVVIGRNKRNDSSHHNHEVMGRKGIGKLAALFLTKEYVFVTKKQASKEDFWMFTYDETEKSKPGLQNIKSYDMVLLNQFRKNNSGTLLRLNKVNLQNFGDEAINALKLTMSNYFLYDELADIDVNFYVLKDKNDTFNYESPEKISKSIAFKNMIAICSDKEHINNFQASKLTYYVDNSKDSPTNKITIDICNEEFSHMNSEIKYKGFFTQNGINKEYELKGWIGIHSTIKMSEAKNNDPHFIKNKYYNPNTLRLYIRNKLAVGDFLHYLKNTQQGINYIEGEISFDLLDADEFEDITTSNRQDVDIHDERVQLLIQLVSNIVNYLISARNRTVKKINDEIEKEKENIEEQAKLNAKVVFEKDLSDLGKSKEEIDQLTTIFTNKFKGDVNLKAKNIYKIFLSHSRKDIRFSDFIYNLLIKKGAKSEEIFYTSNYVLAESNLASNIKRNIISNNVYVVFLDTMNFIHSQYCLFEGGAFWATRTVEECLHLHFGIKCIPDYLNNNEKYHVALCNSQNNKINESIFELDRRKYNELVSAINLMIEHLNRSSLHIYKKISELLLLPSVPSDIELERQNKCLKDLMDRDFVEYRDFYVVSGKTDKKPDGTIKTKDEFIFEYNNSEN